MAYKTTVPSFAERNWEIFTPKFKLVYQDSRLISKKLTVPLVTVLLFIEKKIGFL